MKLRPYYALVHVFIVVFVVGLVLGISSIHSPTTHAAGCVFRSPVFDYYPGFQPTTGNAPLPVTASWTQNWSFNEYVDPSTGQQVFGPSPIFFLDWGDGTVDLIPYIECPGDPTTGAAPFRDWLAQQLSHTYSGASSYNVQLIGRTPGSPDSISPLLTIQVQSATTGGFTNVIPNATAIMQSQAEPGWPGGPIPYSWDGGHGKKPGPSLGNCKGYTGKIHPCPANHTVGLDCSGFTRWVYYLAYGRDVFGRGSTNDQVKKLQRTTSPQPGDLVFFGLSTTNTDHVGIYIGNGQMINAFATGTYVRTDPIKSVRHFIGYYHYNG